MTSEIAAPKRNGIAVLWDMLIAPTAAFAELRAVPHWGWALLLTCVLGTIGGYLQVPASEHASAYTVAHDPRFAAFTPEQAESAKKTAAVIQRFAWMFFSIQAALAVAITALLFLVANAIGKGTGTFLKFFALAANVAFLNFGIGFLLHGVITMVRDPAGFNTTIDLLSVLPNLGWLAPGADPHVVAFLTSFTIFQIWSVVLMALGLRAIAGLSAAVAWTTSILIALVGGLLVASATVH
jgi:hypothetical protein